MELKGSKTAKNVLTAFAGNHRPETVTPISPARRERKGTFRLRTSSRKQPARRRNTPNDFSHFLTGGSPRRVNVSGRSNREDGPKPEGRRRRRTPRVDRSLSVLFKDCPDEGFTDIADAFSAILVAERQHEKRYLGLLANVGAAKVFKKDQTVVWQCRNCGYLHEGKEAPQTCPACAHPQAYFELLAENW